MNRQGKQRSRTWLSSAGVGRRKELSAVRGECACAVNDQTAVLAALLSIMRVV
jgi:hypothetical protein